MVVDSFISCLRVSWRQSKNLRDVVYSVANVTCFGHSTLWLTGVVRMLAGAFSIIFSEEPILDRICGQPYVFLHLSCSLVYKL